MDEIDFSQWLQDRLSEKGWTKAELSRRSGVSAPQITRIIKREQSPGHNSLKAFARLFQIEIEDLYRIAGKFPPTTHKNGRYQRIADLPPDQRKIIEEFMDFLIKKNGK